jgi:hypothetical protein
MGTTAKKKAQKVSKVTFQRGWSGRTPIGMRRIINAYSMHRHPCSKAFCLTGGETVLFI